MDTNQDVYLSTDIHSVTGSTKESGDSVRKVEWVNVTRDLLNLKHQDLVFVSTPIHQEHMIGHSKPLL